VANPRQDLRDALDPTHGADAACISALDGGASFDTTAGAVPVENLVTIYSRRVEHLRRKKARTVGSEEVVERLRLAERPLRIASVDDHDWHFVVFLDAASGKVVSSWGVEKRMANARTEA
jgi:hypothetical protein